MGAKRSNLSTLGGNIDKELRNSFEMPRKERFSISPLGEYYLDLLTVDARINARSKAIQANSLLCAKLQERENRIRERVAYLARKRNITPEEMWMLLLNGEELTPEELADASITEEEND